MRNPEKWLKIAFLVGAGSDGLAAVAMLVPALSQPVWGLSGLSGEYRFAMGYGASLMAGWTALLCWAARRPLERRFVALLTVVPVLAGLVLTELFALGTGLVVLAKLLPLLVMQHAAIAVLGSLYHATRATA
jgi:hypothetical protein